MSRYSERFQARAGLLLTILIILNMTYPISEINQEFAVLYLTAYLGLLAIGVYIISITARAFVISSVVALFVIVIGLFWIQDIQNPYLGIGTTIGLVIFELILVWAMLQYVFFAPRVTRDVLITGIAVYIAIVNIFTPLTMVIELLTQVTLGTSAYVVSGDPSIAVTWQHMIYFNFVTLTTLGYGDTLPITSVSQAFTSAEAVIGVLYPAVLIGRLVGLYSQPDDV